MTVTDGRPLTQEAARNILGGQQADRDGHLGQRLSMPVIHYDLTRPGCAKYLRLTPGLEQHAHRLVAISSARDVTMDELALNPILDDGSVVWIGTQGGGRMTDGSNWRYTRMRRARQLLREPGVRRRAELLIGGEPENVARPRGGRAAVRSAALQSCPQPTSR